MDKENFSYSYSAKRQNEIKKIKEKYTPKTDEESKMEKIYRLDQSVSRKATITSLVFGVLGTLIMGFGLSCVLVWSNKLFVFGIIVSIFGIVILSAAYPVYLRVYENQKVKVAPLILKLTSELEN